MEKINLNKPPKVFFKQNNLREWCKTDSTTNIQLENLGSNPSSRISLELVENKTQKFSFEQIVKNYHTYKPNVNLVGRRIDWLVKENDNYIGAIGVGSSVMAMKPRDDFIGWKKDARLKNLVKTCTNWRYCLKDNHPNSSKILSLFVKEARKEWKKKFGNNLVLIETLVEPPYTGTCYRASNWILVGETQGCQFEWIEKKELIPIEKNKYSHEKFGNVNVTQKFMKFGDKIDYNTWKCHVGSNNKKLIFVKPLHRYWKKELNTLNEKEVNYETEM